jgi:hypothetical protein
MVSRRLLRLQEKRRGTLRSHVVESMQRSIIPRRLPFVVRLVLRHSPTSPARSCPQFGSWRLRTGLGRLSKTCRRYPGSRACCFSACAGSQTAQDRTIHSRLTWLLCCLPPLGTESACCSIGFSKLNRPVHRYLCLGFKRYLAMSPAKLEATMDSLLSFPIGLFHPYNMPVYAGALRVADSSGAFGQGPGYRSRARTTPEPS